MIEIFVLTLRQLVRRRRFLVVLALAAVPVLVAALYAAASDRPDPVRFLDGAASRLIISVVLPLVVLLLATASLGDEVEDRTLAYLILKPLPRRSIALAKLAAPLVVGALVLGVSAAATALLISDDAGAAVAVTAGVLVGAAGYAAIFTWGGLALRWALQAGFVYIFLWEASLGGLFSGIRFLSIRQYALAAVRGMDPDLLVRDSVALQADEALAGLGIVMLLFTWLTVRRLRRMDVP